ncbi:MAG: type III restriction-modification system endonuclease [Bacteroidaceae bacterium]|nr:type III restriction-modification system endonuclease [Prevotellaceae bacterium]MDY5760248.1 type III restriction-modification system endonuclease [Bacteroidaceae bacterium]
MDIILEAGLPHQQIPVERLASVFEKTHLDAPVRPYENPLIDHQDISTEWALRRIENTEELRAYNRKVMMAENGVLNLDIKMETGTGKTYVYTHSIYELHKRYGFNKFVVIVHSLPVKSGAVQFISDPYVQRHFRDTLGYGTEIDLCEVSALKKKKKGHNYFPSSVRDFVNGSCQNKNRIYVIVVNQQLLQKGKLLDKKDYDIAVQGFVRPLDAIKATRPIVIIDEPHRFERSNTTYKRILSEIAPQCIIRFGATFPEIAVPVLKPNKQGKLVKQKESQKDYLNLLYNLTACDAFNQNLIKGVAKEHFNPTTSENEKVKVVSIDGKESVTMHFTKKDHSQRFVLHKDESLGVMSEHLSGITVSGISSSEVELSNGQTKHVGDEFTADIYSTSYQENMIRLAIQRHFETERQLFHRESKIKTLALFFIDNIVSFRGDEQGDGAWLRDLFDKWLEYQLREELKNGENSEEYTDYLNASLQDIAGCRAGYFAKDNNDSDEAIAEEVDDILRNKKKLLSFKDENGNWNVRRFLFSKWTLKEGWDNPNVFTIAKLRSSGSEISKLQEVGRGLRLPVDEYGNRTSSNDFMLSYIVDFTEKDFADKLVREINGDVAKKATEHIVISREELDRVANLRGMSNGLMMLAELIQKGYVDMKGTDVIVKDDTIMEFKNEYPEFSLDSLNINRVINRNASNNRLMVKIRKPNYQKLESLWKEINKKYLMFYQKNIDKEIEKALPSILEDGVFSRMSVSSERSEIEVDEEGASVVCEANVTYLVHGRNMLYHEFLKRASKGTSISIEMIHKAICEYAKNHKEFNNDLINDLTLSQLIGKFRDWKINNLGGCISYKQANYRAKTTALTNADGSVRDEVVMGRLGKKTDNSKVPSEYLYEPIAFDSPLERTNILDKIDVAELVVYGKIPNSSIRIPTITDETYSPDFMYVVKKKDGTMQMNVVIETKDVNQDTDLRPKESAKINCAKLFFEQISKDNPSLPVKFERQINRQRMNDIIDRLLTR